MQFVMCFSNLLELYYAKRCASYPSLYFYSTFTFTIHKVYFQNILWRKIGNFHIYESFANRFDWIIKKNRFKRIIRSRIGHHSRLGVERSEHVFNNTSPVCILSRCSVDVAYFVEIAYRKFSFIAGSVNLAYFVKTAYQCLWRVCCFDSPWFNKNTVYKGVCCFDGPWFNKNTVYKGVCCFDSPWFNKKNTVYKGVCCFDSPWFNKKNTVYKGVCCFDSHYTNTYR